MKVGTILKLFAEQQQRSLVTDAEKAKLIEITTETERIQGHYEKYRVGTAKRLLDKARGDYTADPSEVNRANLDKMEASWLQLDSEHAAQRQIIYRAIRDYATSNLKPLLPPILRRCAKALKRVLDAEEAFEKKRHEEFEVPWTASSIIFVIKNEIFSLDAMAGRIESSQFEADCGPYKLMNCHFIPDIVDLEGPLFDWAIEAAAPVATRGKSLRKFPNAKEAATVAA